MRLPTAVALLALSLSAVPAFAARTTDLWERTVPVSGRPRLTVTSNDAHVRVGVWDRPAIGLRVTTRGWEIGDDVRVNESHVGNDVKLDVREPTFRMGFVFVDRRSILIEVWMPRSADLDVSTGDGNITVPGLQGTIALRTGDGDIAIEDARGAIRLRTGDGRITGRGLDGTLAATTGDGTVRVQGRFEALELRTGDGNVTAEVAPGSRVREPWSARTGDGGVTMLIPPDLKADVEAYTGDGGITVDLPMMLRGRVTNHRVLGALNGGGPPLVLRTGDGSIRLAGLASAAR